MIREVRQAAAADGRHVCLVASVCGTDDDPQDASAQREALVEAGVLVEGSNAQAVRAAGLCAEARGAHGTPEEAKSISPVPGAPAWPEVGPIVALLRQKPAVINVGLELFAESLQAQGVPVVSVDWRPPAGGKRHLLDLLDKLEG
jgi:FdrA protein